MSPFCSSMLTVVGIIGVIARGTITIEAATITAQSIDTLTAVVIEIVIGRPSTLSSGRDGISGGEDSVWMLSLVPISDVCVCVCESRQVMVWKTRDRGGGTWA